MELFNKDINNAISALECLIIDLEEYNIQDLNGGDDQTWDRIEELTKTLNNFKLIQSIYGA